MVLYAASMLPLVVSSWSCWAERPARHTGRSTGVVWVPDAVVHLQRVEWVEDGRAISRHIILSNLSCGWSLIDVGTLASPDAVTRTSAPCCWWLVPEVGCGRRCSRCLSILLVWSQRVIHPWISCAELNASSTLPDGFNWLSDGHVKTWPTLLCTAKRQALNNNSVSTFSDFLTFQIYHTDWEKRRHSHTHNSIHCI